MKRVTPSLEGAAGSSLRPGEKRRDLLLYVEDDDENWDVAEYRLSGAYQMLRAPN